eukprot:CAMPEP_0167804550 /NCGR_PEP_ID=MMETSP0111_2-20121227/20555_1 /TAXON_ID=91324 /ORGANISM="Lotharella globosa, Strain CCCM811" /LENGTH=41 /DNA_ID= /DNA_START= /DNA_END= /DNA_ORIENTATION=
MSTSASWASALELVDGFVFASKFFPGGPSSFADIVPVTPMA